MLRNFSKVLWKKNNTSIVFFLALKFHVENAEKLECMNNILNKDRGIIEYSRGDHGGDYVNTIDLVNRELII